MEKTMDNEMHTLIIWGLHRDYMHYCEYSDYQKTIELGHEGPWFRV